MPINIFIVDDHRILRDGLRMLLELQGDIHVVGEAEDGRKAVELPPEAVPIVQKQVLKAASRWGRFGITATQMLESMTTNSRSTGTVTRTAYDIIARDSRQHTHPYSQPFIRLRVHVKPDGSAGISGALYDTLLVEKRCREHVIG